MREEFEGRNDIGCDERRKEGGKARLRVPGIGVGRKGEGG